MNPKLLDALKNGDIKTLEELIASGVDIQQRDKDKDESTALMHAVRFGQLGMVKYLLKKGYSKTSEKNKDGATVLLVAVISAAPILVIDYLLSRPDVSLQEVDDHGLSVLPLAVALCHFDNRHTYMLRYLIAKGAYIDMVSNQGLTPYEYAIRMNIPKEAADFLKNAETLFQQANDLTFGHKSLSELRQLGWVRGAMNSRRISDGNTAIHVAIMKKNGKFIHSFIQMRPDLFLTNHNNVNSLQLLEETYPDSSVSAAVHCSIIVSLGTPIGKLWANEQRLALMDAKELKEASDTKESFDEESAAEEKILLERFDCSINVFKNTIEKITNLQTKIGLLYTLGNLFFKCSPFVRSPSIVHDPRLYRPEHIYYFLSQIPSTDQKLFEEAHAIIARMLIEDKGAFDRIEAPKEAPKQREVKALDEIETLALDATDLPDGLDLMVDEARADRRNKMVIEHILYSNHHSLYEYLMYSIAEYTFMSKETSEQVFKNVKTMGPELMLALIEEYRAENLRYKAAVQLASSLPQEFLIATEKLKNLGPQIFDKGMEIYNRNFQLERQEAILMRYDQRKAELKALQEQNEILKRKNHDLMTKALYE